MCLWNQVHRQLYQYHVLLVSTHVCASRIDISLCLAQPTRHIYPRRLRHSVTLALRYCYVADGIVKVAHMSGNLVKMGRIASVHCSGPPIRRSTDVMLWSTHKTSHHA